MASALRAGQGERLSNSPGGTYGCFSREKGSIGSLTISSISSLFDTISSLLLSSEVVTYKSLVDIASAAMTSAHFMSNLIVERRWCVILRGIMNGERGV